MLADATWYIDAANPAYSGGQTVPNLGTGGTALDATLGSTGGADTNDPAWLEYDPAAGAYCWLPGVGGNHLSIPDSSALDITGDIDIRVHVAMDDWTPASTQGLLTKYEAGSSSSYMVWVNSSGNVVLYWTTDGSTPNAKSSTVPTGVTNGTAKWVRVTLDVDNGGNHDVKFWLSDDNVTYTQLGSTVTTAGVTSIFSGTSELRVGNASGTSLAGKVYRAQVYNGIAGTKVLDVNLAAVTDPTQATFVEQSSNAATVTISRSGSGRKSVAVLEDVFSLGSDDYIYSTATGTSQIVVNRTWSGSTPTFTIGYNTSPNGQIGSGGVAPTDGEVIASAMWGRTLSAGEQAALLTYFQTRG
jgi:hypothetical protein